MEKQLTEQQMYNLLNAIRERKSAAVLVTELIEEYHDMCDREIGDALVEIRAQIEAENWAHQIRVKNAEYEKTE